MATSGPALIDWFATLISISNIFCASISFRSNDDNLIHKRCAAYNIPHIGTETWLHSWVIFASRGERVKQERTVGGWTGDYCVPSLCIKRWWWSASTNRDRHHLLLLMAGQSGWSGKEWWPGERIGQYLIYWVTKHALTHFPEWRCCGVAMSDCICFTGAAIMHTNWFSPIHYSYSLQSESIQLTWRICTEPICSDRKY